MQDEISEILSKEFRLGLGDGHQTGRLNKLSGYLATDQRPWSSTQDSEQVVPTQHIATPPRHIVVCFRPITKSTGNHTHRIQIQFQMTEREFVQGADTSRTNVKQCSLRPMLQVLMRTRYTKHHHTSVKLGGNVILLLRTALRGRLHASKHDQARCIRISFGMILSKHIVE
jgi:hypothetical protein